MGHILYPSVYAPAALQEVTPFALYIALTRRLIADTLAQGVDICTHADQSAVDVLQDPGDVRAMFSNRLAITSMATASSDMFAVISP